MARVGAMITEPAQSEPPSVTKPAAKQPVGQLTSDVGHSIRNALKLGMGLLGSWAVALLIRLALPRFLGISLFGELQFADAFTTTVFVVIILGVETYARREIATRREHASDFVGGTLVIGLVIGAIAMAVALASLNAAGKSQRVLELVFILGIAQMLTNINALFAALLHAVGKVDGLSYLQVGSKLAWGLGIAIALALGYGVLGVAFAMLGSELLRIVGLVILSRRNVGLLFRIDLPATWKVIVTSFPFYVGGVAQIMYAKIDVSIMSFLTTDREVGWYGAASTLAGISLLLSPLISWVLLPLSTRAALRSEDELMTVAKRSMELILVLAFPVTLFLGVGAEFIITAAFGAQFAPAEHSLRILAPTFILTYAAIVTATLLVRMGRGWAVTWTSVAGMFLAPALNLFLVPRCFARFGPGGAGIGAAISLTLTELFTAGVMTYLLGMHAFDRRSVVALLKTLACGALVVIADQVLRFNGIGAWRLLLDGFLYVTAVTISGALDVRGGIALARSAMESRSQKAAAEGAGA